MKKTNRWLLAVVLHIWASVTGPAATRTVMNTDDSGPGSLRQRIIESADGDTINFAVTAVIVLTSGELFIERSLNMTGPGAQHLAISANNFSRVLCIASGTVSISDLTIRRGRVTGPAGSPGSALNPSGGPGGWGVGGGIYNDGMLTLVGCVLTENCVTGGNGADGMGGPFGAAGSGGSGGWGAGGALFNDANGAVTAIGCTFSGNCAVGGSGGNATGGFLSGGSGGAGGPASGGAIYNGHILTLANCTFNADLSIAGAGGQGGSGTYGGVGGSGGIAYGGAIASDGAVTLNNCTIRGNFAFGDVGGQGGVGPIPGANGQDGTGVGGGLHCATTLATSTRNTILAGNTADWDPDVACATIVSLGHNFIGQSDGIQSWGDFDQVGAIGSPLDPGLGPLQNNGGPTPTMALSLGSAAIDAGDDSVLDPPIGLMTDQRGWARKNGEHVDIGAYEYGDVFRTLVVRNLKDDGSIDSLRDVLGKARDGDRIVFFPGLTGTIPATNHTLGLLFNVSSRLAIVGPGAGVVTIAGGTGLGRIHGDVSISGLTFSNISAGISPAAFYVFSGARLQLRDCVLTRLRALDAPGAIENHGELLLDGCVLSGNDTGFFGAALLNSGSATVMNCSFLENGGVEALSGAIYNVGRLVLNSTTFASNTCPSVSGGGLVQAGGTVSATNCTFSRNTAGQEGGAIYVRAGDLFLTSCTVASNRAGMNGGGLYNLPANNTARLANCLVAGNSAETGPDANGFYTSDGYNLIGQSSATIGFGATGDQLGTIASPIDPRLGPLQNNGGPTWTMALRSGSPALDKGRSFGLTADQRGRPRPTRLPFISISTNGLAGADGTDIGAFEANPLPFVITAIQKTAANATITFNSEAGWGYDLQGKTDLASTEWTTIVANAQGAVGSTAVIDTAMGVPRKFYRVRLRP